MKNLIYLFLLLFANAIYGGNCNGNYTFTYGSYSNCSYWFFPSYPGSPTVAYVTFTISSSGTSGVVCDTALRKLTSDTCAYRFCFDGTHDVTMTIHFSSGATCDVVQTINFTCSGEDVCDPNPSRTATITNPTVEITYIQPDTCSYNSGSPITGCMNYDNGNNTYTVVCGWRWAIRVHPDNDFRCHKFSYYVQYDSITTCGNYTCVTRNLIDTNIVCIDAYVDRTIYVVATSSSCCLPVGYQRGTFWTPSPNCAYTTICPPISTISTTCQSNRNCPYGITYCAENPATLTASSGWPAPCFTGGGTKIEQRDYIKLDDNFTKEQDVIIYNIQGIEVFNGKWRFGDPSNLYLNWPNGIGTGLYFVRFQNSTEKGLLKLFKIN